MEKLLGVLALQMLLTDGDSFIIQSLLSRQAPDEHVP